MPEITLIVKEGGEVLLDIDGFEHNPDGCEEVIKQIEASLIATGLEVKELEAIRHPTSMRRVPLPKKKQTQQMD